MILNIGKIEKVKQRHKAFDWILDVLFDPDDHDSGQIIVMFRDEQKEIMGCEPADKYIAESAPYQNLRIAQGVSRLGTIRNWKQPENAVFIAEVVKATI